MNKVKDKTLLLLSSIGAAAFLFMALVEHKPNRIAQGIKYTSFKFLGNSAIIVLILWIILMALSFYDKKYKDVSVFLFTSILIISIFWSIQVNTAQYTEGNPAARITLSAGFYIQILSIYFMFSTYTEKIKDYRYIVIIGFVAIAASLVYFIMTGKLDDLSLIKEYNTKKTQFYDNLRIHALLTFGAVITGAIIAIPLGFLAYSKKILKARSWSHSV